MDLQNLSRAFLKTMVDYNQATYPAQIFIFTVGLILTVLLYRKPGRITRIAMKAYLFFCFSWISMVFFIMHGSSELRKEFSAGLFGLIAICFLIDIFIDKMKFERNRTYDKGVFIFYTLFLAYPLVSLLLGREFLELVNWLMPCPLTVFTITLLISFMSKANYPVYALLIIWALTGAPKSILFDVPEDIILGLSGLYAIVVLVVHKKHSRKIEAGSLHT